MKKKQKHYLVVFGLIFLISILIPGWLWIRDYYLGMNESINSSVLSEFATFQSWIIGFWALILNLVLVIIAYKAFRNFDVKKQFHNKQLDIVSEFAKAISSTELSNMMYETKYDPKGVGHRIATGFTFSFFGMAFAFDYSKFEMMCVKTNNIENTFPFLKYQNHPLLPKSISEKLNKLYRPLHYSLPVSKNEYPENYVVLYSKEIDKDDYSKDWVYELYKNPNEFRRDCENLRKAIIEWYKQFGADDLNI